MEIRRKSKPGSGTTSTADAMPSPSPTTTPYKRNEPTNAYAARYSPSFEERMDGADDGDFDDSVDDWMEHADDADIVDDDLVCTHIFSCTEHEQDADLVF